MSRAKTEHVLALCGGVGGAKMAWGLNRLLEPGRLTVAVNTGDDMEHLGLTICPDLDTVLYTLADIADRERGWGLAGESWAFMAALKRMSGEEAWFQLGDQDLATHVARTRRLAEGQTLSGVSGAFAEALGVACRVVPMSDQTVRTVLETDEGDMAFQRYFVARKCAPAVRAVRFDGADDAQAAPAFDHALCRSDLSAILICPSNPYLSIDPILALPGVRKALASRRATSVAVSPIIAGRALKGPAAKLMRELGIEPSAVSIAAHYAGLIDVLVLDQADADLAPAVAALGIRPIVTKTIMRSNAERVALARAALAAAGVSACSLATTTA